VNHAFNEINLYIHIQYADIYLIYYNIQFWRIV